MLSVYTFFVLNNFDSAMSRVNEQSWCERVNQYAGPSGHGRNKLRTYTLFKSEFKPEPYVTMIMSRSNRSALARFYGGFGAQSIGAPTGAPTGAPIGAPIGAPVGAPIGALICTY